MQFRSGSGKFKFKFRRYFTIFYDTVFKSVAHNLESSSDSPGPKLCTTFLNIATHFKTIRFGCGSVAVNFSIYLSSVLYVYFMSEYCQDVFGVGKNGGV